jgi:hypothetical protein
VAASALHEPLIRSRSWNAQQSGIACEGEAAAHEPHLPLLPAGGPPALWLVCWVRLVGYLDDRYFPADNDDELGSHRRR